MGSVAMGSVAPVNVLMETQCHPIVGCRVVWCGKAIQGADQKPDISEIKWAPVSVHFSLYSSCVQARKLTLKGELKEAREASKDAKAWAYSAVAMGICVILSIIALIFFAVTEPPTPLFSSSLWCRASGVCVCMNLNRCQMYHKYVYRIIYLLTMYTVIKMCVNLYNNICNSESGFWTSYLPRNSREGWTW